MAQLTPRQTQILQMIQDFIAEYGMPPTRAEIARELGFKSANAAEEHLRALQKKGVLELMPGASRGIQLKDSLRDQLGLPLVGRVAAGNPILAEEHIEGRYQIDPALFNPKPHYLLRVHGMSMKNAGIMENDMVVVRPQSAAENGEIVAALLGNEATVKRFHQRRGQVVLEPDNPEFEPIIVRSDRQDFQLIGVVVGLLRNYR